MAHVVPEDIFHQGIQLPRDDLTELGARRDILGFNGIDAHAPGQMAEGFGQL